MKPPKLWVLVADASRARIVRNFAPSQKLVEDTELVVRSEHRRLKEIMTDKPGRSFAPVGSRRSSMEYRSNPVREDEKSFARTIVDMLNIHRLAGDFDQLAIYAAPRMLGDLHRILPASLRRVTIAEVPKDLTKLPALELHEAISELNISTITQKQGSKNA